MPGRAELVEMIERTKETISFDARLAQILERSATDYRKKSVSRRAVITLKRIAANVFDAPARLIRQLFYRSDEVIEVRSQARVIARHTVNDFIQKDDLKELVREGAHSLEHGDQSYLQLRRSTIEELVHNNVNKIVAEKVASEIEERLSHER